MATGGARAFAGVLLLLLAAGLMAAPAPAGHRLFRTYGAREGLLNLNVLQLEQDRDGYLWVGTEDGLYRYDGYGFEAYGLDAGLDSTNVDVLHEDGAGRLWVGTRVGLFRRSGRKFSAVPVAAGLPAAAVVGVADDGAALWVATEHALFRGDGERFAAVAVPDGGDISALWHARGSARLALAQWNGRARVQLRDGERWHEAALPDAAPAAPIEALAEDGAGRLFARSRTALWRLDPGADAFVVQPTPTPLKETRGYLRPGRHGDLWVPTLDGLWRLRGDTWSTIGLAGMLTGNRPVLEDRQGTIWLGSMGLHRLLGSGIFHTYTQAEGRRADIAWTILRDSTGTLWVGTDQGLERQVGERFETLPGTERNTIRWLANGPDGKLYGAGFPVDSLLVVDPRTGHVEERRLLAPGAAKTIYRLLAAPDGTLWIATNGAGLHRADLDAPQRRPEPVSLPGGTPTERIVDLDLDARGRLWVTGERGLAVLDGGTWRRFTQRDGLRDDFVAYARDTRDGDLLITYFEPHGYTRARYVDGALTILAHSVARGERVSDKIFLIGEDAQGRTWVGGGRGVDVVGPQGTQHFGAADGLVGEDTASMAFLAEPDGDVWIGTSAGLARFDAAAYAEIEQPAPLRVVLDDLRLGTQALPREASNSVVPHEVDTFDMRYSALDFRHEGQTQYRVQLVGRDAEPHVTAARDARYTALDYGDYRFEAAARVGSDGPWGPVATFTFRVLPAWWQTPWARGAALLLAVGAIVLLVRWRIAVLARRNRQLETQVGLRTAELSLANARLSVANMALAERNDELEALTTSLATAQSQLLAAEKLASVGQLAAGVAHEINNPIGYVNCNLGSLSRYLDDLLALIAAYERMEPGLPPHDPFLADARAVKQRIDLAYLREDAPNLLAEATEGIARVQKIVADLRDFSRIDAPQWQRADLHACIDNALSMVAHDFGERIDVVKAYGTLPLVECLPPHLNQVLFNLLRNAAQAIPDRGIVALRTGTDAFGAWIAVADTGQGMSEAQLKRVFDPFYTTKPIGTGAGLGLSVAYGIMRLHGGRIDVESTLSRGSTFTLHLPLEQPRAANTEPAPSTSA